MNKIGTIFESILKPIENTVDNLERYLDPLLIPESLLPWLASWLGLALDSTWPIERRRQLVKSAAELYRWRGTKHGLSEYLKIYTGSVPEISEYIPGMSLDQDTKLGVNTQLGSPGTGHHFTVKLELDGSQQVNTDTVNAIVNAQKPAHAAYTLLIETSREADE